MSVSSISFYSTSDTTDTSASTQRAQTAQKAAEAAQTAALSEAATVKLTAAAQARLLKLQGESVAQIATALATDTKTIDQYLGITSTTSASNAAALALLG